jgi:hypothetical protein
LNKTSKKKELFCLLLQYNKQKITDALLFKAISKWLKKEWIQPIDVQDLSFDNKSLYPNNYILKRIGLFIATSIAIWGVIGFFSLFLFGLADSNIQLVGLIIIALGVGLFILTEKMIDEKQMFKQGTDDALFLNAIQFVFAGKFSVWFFTFINNYRIVRL